MVDHSVIDAYILVYVMTVNLEHRMKLMMIKILNARDAQNPFPYLVDEVTEVAPRVLP